MDQRDPIELIAREVEGATALCAPDVGWYTRAVDAGRVLVPGEEAGVLVTLGRVRALIVPAGARGVVRTPAPEAVHHPVAWGQELLRLAPLTGTESDDGKSAAQSSTAEAALVVRSDSPGRFWHRPAPDAPALVQQGDTLGEGTPIGLLEVMKTFAQVVYRARGGLPARARVVRLLVGDGADVAVGDALVEVEPL